MLKSAIDTYMNGWIQKTFTKCCCIAGSPGTGKTFCISYAALYAISKGLNTFITALMSTRACQIGGLHVAKMFMLYERGYMNIHCQAELTVQRLLQNPVRLSLLKVLEILFFDELGQCPAELINCLDLIMRKIRNSNLFMGGVLIIGTMDHRQSKPVIGQPILLSPHVITCFNFVTLKKSVRASTDPKFQHIQVIARMHPRKYTKQILSEFRRLLRNTLSFADDWNDDQIDHRTFQIYGRKKPAYETIQEYNTSVKRKLRVSEYRISKAEDVQLPRSSHQEWVNATINTIKCLNNKVKEIEELIFFKGGIYACTYNEENKFSQSQIAILMELPSQEHINEMKKFDILITPPGIKNCSYDETKSEQDYINDG